MRRFRYRVFSRFVGLLGVGRVALLINLLVLVMGRSQDQREAVCLDIRPFLV